MGFTEFDWDSFCEAIARFESLVSAAPAVRTESFDQAVLVAVSGLFTMGASMPTADEVYVGIGGDAVLDVGDVLSEPDPVEVAQAQRLYTSLQQYFGDDDRYFEVFDPFEGSVVNGSLADDVASVASDLLVGLRLWDRGCTAEAMWEWSFGFRHWGEHAAGAMRALHALIHRQPEV